MTDNEKRAHDLAIAMLPERYKEQLETASTIDPDVVRIDTDPVNLYLSDYDAALQAFEQRWPSQD